VAGSVALHTNDELERHRFEIVQRSNDTGHHYDDARQTDQFTLNLLRYSGIRCRILGTFRVHQPRAGAAWQLRFGADIDNFYAGQGMKIYKPRGEALRKIVNYRDGAHRPLVTQRIGRLRYSVAARAGEEAVPVEIAAEDFIAQRTALFGMTRTGKSNTTKTIAAALFKLRERARARRVGQLIFDPNGEYANDNPQDQGCIRNLKYLEATPSDDVHTYGSFPHPHDPERHITKFNFYGEQEPSTPPRPDELDSLLRTLYEGKRIIDDALAEEGAGYITAFRASSVRPGPGVSARSEYTRFRRRLFVYRGILARIGFDAPARPADAKGLFGQELRDLMRQSDQVQQYVDVLESGSIPWDVVGHFTEAFAGWVKDKDKQFQAFDSHYATAHEGRNWSDPHLLGLLGFYDNTRARSLVRTTRDWHDLDEGRDYAENIVHQVRAGKLVIVDQLLGDPDMHRQAAQRIVERLFRAQQRSFSRPRVDPATGAVVQPPPVVVYVEEAHTLLPPSSEDDTTNIWARIAKEGAKFNIGMVYSTQEPSSLQINILKNTENWFIAHLNNTDEVHQIRKFNDFADFAAGIIHVAEPGFTRVRTHSSCFTLPVQIDRFTAPRPLSG